MNPAFRSALRFFDRAPVRVRGIRCGEGADRDFRPSVSNRYRSRDLGRDRARRLDLGSFSSRDRGVLSLVHHYKPTRGEHSLLCFYISGLRTLGRQICFRGSRIVIGERHGYSSVDPHRVLLSSCNSGGNAQLPLDHVWQTQHLNSARIGRP